VSVPNSYIVGEVIELNDLVTDPSNNNAPVTGATDVLTVYQPDQTTVTPSVTDSGGGVYRADFIPTMAGWHQALFEVAEGNPGAGAGRTVFWVAPVP
jgi:hypothetical protein